MTRAKAVAPTERIAGFFGHGGGVAYYLIAAMLALTAASSLLFAHVWVAHQQHAVRTQPLRGLCVHAWESRTECVCALMREIRCAGCERAI